MPEIQEHFGIYALIFNDNKTHALLIKKALGAYTGLLDLPGGRPDENESREETLRREVREETGCDVTDAQYLTRTCTDFPHHSGGADKILRHTADIFTARIKGTPLEGPAGGDSAGCVWAQRDQLSPQNASPVVLAALESI